MYCILSESTSWRGTWGIHKKLETERGNLHTPQNQNKNERKKENCLIGHCTKFSSMVKKYPEGCKMYLRA
jgi:hypothetical protein